MLKNLFMCVLLLLSEAALSKARTCESFFPNPPVTAMSWDLLLQRRIDLDHMSKEQTNQAAQKFLTDLLAYRPPQNSNRARSLLMHQAHKLLEVARNNEVVGAEARDKYANPNFLIGYCFGRATFIHLMLLKMGLQKESIFKLWAVGPITTNIQGVIWSHHVTTIAFTRDKGWVTLDTNESKPEPVEYWMNSHLDRSVDGQVRFYLTDASKFGVDLGPYSRFQMGLDLPQGQDVYFGYFKDMLQMLKTKSLSYFGLKTIPPEKEGDRDSFVPEVRSKKGIFGNLKDFIWG